MSQIDIVIVNWNAGPLLRQCVNSIFDHESETLGRVVIVDNASRDRSADFARVDPRVRLTSPGRNLGFGNACNLGAAEGVSEYILFLNPDTQFLRPTLGVVLEFMKSPAAKSTGVCGVRLVNERNVTWRHCSRFPSPATFVSLSMGLPKLVPWMFPPLELLKFDHEHDADVPHVMGAFYLIRRALFEQLGGFDPQFFVYHEDLDLSLRVHRAGCKVHYLAEASIYHRTAGTSSGAKAKALSYLLESRIRYARKHFGSLGFILVAAAAMFMEPIRRLAQAALSGAGGAMRETINAYRRLYAMRMGRAVDRD